MKILVLTHEYPPVGGGGGRVALDLASGLSARGHDIRVLTSHMEGLPYDEVVDGVSVTRIPSSRREAFRAQMADMLHYDWAVFHHARKLFRTWKPDLIHAHFAVPAGAAAFALSLATGILYVLTAHLGDVPGAVPEKTDQWFRFIYPFTHPIWRRAKRVVAVSEFTHGLARKHYDVPMQVIHNGVALSALPKSVPAEDNVPRIVFAGRFAEVKNPQHLVQALSNLKELSWSCVMLGDGPLLDGVRHQVSSAGLDGRVALPGWVTPEQVLDHFARSDILALPSRAEGLSVAGVQALGMGLAMVLSAAGGNLELVENGCNGFFVPIGDVDALTEALRKLLESPDLLALCRENSLKLAQNFSLDRIIMQYEELFLDVLQKRK